MDFSILTYNFSHQFNIGDYIQSLAAKQFLPHVDRYINREKLSDYAGPATKMIMNGWFMNHPENWPPSNLIDPLFISFHINSSAKEKLLNKDGLDYLRQHEPIGCRDLHTQQLLKQNGVKTYFSGCLTLALGKAYQHHADDEILLVDVLYRYLRKSQPLNNPYAIPKAILRGDTRPASRYWLLQKIIGRKILQNTQELTHIYPTDKFDSEQSRLDLADTLLRRYAKAKLVVTSRIHCALPCLAMGTPVIFIDGGFSKTFHRCRFDGITDLFHTVKIRSYGRFSANFDLATFKRNGDLAPKTEYLKYLDTLAKNCDAFIGSTMNSLD